MWADSLSRSKYYQLTIVVHSKTVFRLCLYKDFFIISVSISCFFTIQAWIFVSIVHKYVGCCISRVQSEIKEGIIEMHSITNTWTHHKLSLKSSVTAYKITRPSQNLRLTRNLSLFSLRIQRSRSHWNDFKSFINVWLTLHKVRHLQQCQPNDLLNNSKHYLTQNRAETLNGFGTRVRRLIRETDVSSRS